MRNLPDKLILGCGNSKWERETLAKGYDNNVNVK